QYMLGAFQRAPGPEETRDAMVRALVGKKVKPVYRTTKGTFGLTMLSRLFPASAYDFLIHEGMKRLKQICAYCFISERYNVIMNEASLLLDRMDIMLESLTIGSFEIPSMYVALAAAFLI